MIKRGRRLRTTNGLRTLVRETILNKEDFIYPIFLVEGENIKEEIPSLPGVFHYSVDRLKDEIEEIEELGIKGVLLFGIPDNKDYCGSEAFSDNGIVQRGIREVKAISSDLIIITDVCLCQYTDHGHCGLLDGHKVMNDETLEYLGKTAVSHGKAGAHMVAPSGMMDGRIGAIRKALDENSLEDVSIMSYSAKYSSAFYGPFREAAHSTPSFGDRKTYQMDFGNRREALREIEKDIEEGADIVMIKPALSYLDIIRETRDNFQLPIAAYSVSGEYAMIKNAGKMGIINEEKVMMEMITSIKRAGADIIITYFAKDICRIIDSGK